MGPSGTPIEPRRLAAASSKPGGGREGQPSGKGIGRGRWDGSAPRSPAPEGKPRKLLLRCAAPPSDIVLLTAAVRDLHDAYPSCFLTDVRTSAPELWEHNPYLTPLSDADPEVETIACVNPLSARANRAPYHAIHGYIECLNRRLGLRIEPRLFRGDLRLSAEEKSWRSQVWEIAGEDIPFWVVSTGCGYDRTVGWWAVERYQQVVDHFDGRIQFVQVGEATEHHPRLERVIDLRGQTDLRQLVRLVYHADGILGPVGLPMHLAPAIERKAGERGNRACVVVAGSREPAHWLAYPDHQYLHRNGALPCARRGGCFKDRIAPLGDGDERDERARLCRVVRDGMARCMAMISAAEVIERLDWYFRGGAFTALSRRRLPAARRGVEATRRNPFDRRTLTLSNAGCACEEYLRSIGDYPGTFRGKGIVLCAGGTRYFTGAWVCVHMLRRLGCHLPVEFWHIGPKELDPEMRALVAPLGVECVDALRVRRQHPVRILKGWELKAYALLHCGFEEVLMLDADNVPVRNPEDLFEAAPFRERGAVFWPDYGRSDRANPVWRSCGLPSPTGPEFESGQLLVDKRRCWRALKLCHWFNDHSDFYYQYFHGDKDTFHLAFEKTQTPYHLIPTPIHPLPATMCQHDFDGRRLFQHRNADKWDLMLDNWTLPGFEFEEECRQYIRDLRRVWDGSSAEYQRWRKRVPSTRRERRARANGPSIRICMLSCPARDDMRAKTLHHLASTDWGETPVYLHIDDSADPDARRRQTEGTRVLLRRALEWECDYVLFLEDDLEFNRHLRHNLESWLPIRERAVTLASLYNPGIRTQACSVAHHYRIVRGQSIFGSQALIVSRSLARYALRHWKEIEGMQDIRLSRLAARLRNPIFYHSPSLVQHRGRQSSWGGEFHEARDFDPEWRA